VRFIIELDGVIFDIAAAWHLAHRRAAVAVGWSVLDQATFWRTMRSKGESGDYLPGAKPAKIEGYLSGFVRELESDAVVAAFSVHGGVREDLAGLCREGACIGVSIAPRIDQRRHVLESHGLAGLFTEANALSPDPRRRPVELKTLSEGDPRCVVVAAGDALARSADAAESFCVGVSTGPCSPARLHQAGARLVFRSLTEMAGASRSGASHLVQAGLPPERLG